jgi:hypothetical protein
MKNRLKRIRYRPELIGGFLAQTGFTSNLSCRRRQTVGY